MSKTQRSFKQVLLEAIDEGLLTLGESGRSAVYFHLQSLYSLKKEDVAEKPEAFSEGIRKIFGAGAEIVEKAAVKSLFSKLGLSFVEKKNFNFVEYIKKMQKK